MEILTAVLPTYAKSLMLNARQVGDGEAWLRAQRGPEVERAMRISKAAVPAAGTSSGNWASGMVSDNGIAVSAFLASLRSTSIFFRLLADDAIVRVPWRTRVGLSTANATAYILGEGLPAPLTKLTLEYPELMPKKACGLMVATEELIRATDAASQALFTAELRGAVGNAVDKEFFDFLVDPSAVLPSNGTSAVAARQDLRDLLLAINTTEARLYWVMATDVGKMAAALGDSTGGAAFLDMAPDGGELLGLPALVSSVVPSGTLHLVDAASLIGNAGDIDLSASRHADIEMLDAALLQDSTAPAGSTLVSMFQTNSVALRAVVDFAVEKLRAGAIATISDIQWGQES